MMRLKAFTTEHFNDAKTSKWMRIAVSYAVLWASIVAFWIVYMTIFQQTIDERVPKLQLNNSPIGSNPGLSIRPRPQKSKLDSSLIHFQSSSFGDWQHWVENINSYIKPYQELEAGAGQHAQGDCNLFGERDPHKFCPFNLREIPSHCTEVQNFSFHLGKPCILVKMNRVYGWKPDPYYDRPFNYPKDANFHPGMIQITCDGQTGLDKENIGPIDYYPEFIDPKYFPFTNQPGYQSPFVMVYFKNPRPDVVIFIQCKAWAKNIDLSNDTTGGRVDFQLLID